MKMFLVMFRIFYKNGTPANLPGLALFNLKCKLSCQDPVAVRRRKQQGTGNSLANGLLGAGNGDPNNPNDPLNGKNWPEDDFESFTYFNRDDMDNFLNFFLSKRIIAARSRMNKTSLFNGELEPLRGAHRARFNPYGRERPANVYLTRLLNISED
jgi:hypothetical protein